MIQKDLSFQEDYPKKHIHLTNLYANGDIHCAFTMSLHKTRHIIHIK